MGIKTYIKENKKNIIMFSILILFSTIIFLPWLQGHFSVDTYGVIEKGYDNYAIQNSLTDGRIVMAGFMRLAYWLNLDIIVLVRLTLIISIIITCISIVYLNNIIDKYIKTEYRVIKFITYIISYVIMFNFMYLDNLYFIECAVMSLSLLLHLIASNILLNKQKGYWYKAMLLVLLGVFCYQGTINFFITMTFVLSIMKYDKLNKQVIINMLICGLICLCAVTLNFLQIKIIENIFNVQQTRIKGIETIAKNVKYIFMRIPDIIIHTSKMLKSYCFISFVAILIVLSYLYYMIKNQKEIYKVGNIILICLVAYFSCFVVNLLSLSSIASGRLTFSIGAMIGIMFMYILISTPICEEKIKRNIFITLLILYFGISVINYIQNIYLEKQTNKTDNRLVQYINVCMDNYEKETGNTIKKIAFQTDKNSYICNKSNMSSPMGNSALSPEFSRIGFINYRTNRKLKQVRFDKDIYEIYFKEKDWNEFSEEQCLFIDDTLYYCIY